MRIPLPEFTLDGILSYLLFGGGIAAGFALFNPPMKQVENFIANLKRGA